MYFFIFISPILFQIDKREFAKGKHLWKVKCQLSSWLCSLIHLLCVEKQAYVSWSSFKSCRTGVLQKNEEDPFHVLACKNLYNRLAKTFTSSFCWNGLFLWQNLLLCLGWHLKSLGLYSYSTYVHFSQKVENRHIASYSNESKT